MPPPSEAFSLAGKRVWVAGHRGMVGQALARRLPVEHCEVLTVGREAVDLTDQAQTRDWLQVNRPDAVFLAAAKAGGILANRDFPGEFAFDNLMIAANIIDGAWRAGVGKLIFIGSSAAYPRAADQPIREAALLTGPLDPAHEGYAVAKIAGVKLVQAYRRQHGADFIAVMPTNLYGPGDRFDPRTSHVIPALIRKAHEAKLAGTPEWTIWGSGTPRRDLLHVDDCADALVHLMRTYSGNEPVNIGSGEDRTILEIAEAVATAVGFVGKVVCDRTKPDGTMRKLLDIRRLRAMSWAPSIGLSEGLADTYRWFLANSVNP